MKYVRIAVLLLSSIGILFAKNNTEHKKLEVESSTKTTQLPSQAQSNKLTPMLCVSIQDPSMQWWYNIPANAAPHISEIKKIFYHQEFSLFPFIDNAKIKDGIFKLTYSISMLTPQGNTIDMVKNAKFEGKKDSANIIIACPDVVDVRLDAQYPEGLYKFSMKVKDEISGETADCENFVRLYKWSMPNPFLDKKFVNKYVRAYSLQPSPETLCSLVFSDDFKLEQKGAPNSLNYTYIGFLKAAFKKNLFLIPEIDKNFESMSSHNRAKFLLILAIIDEARIPEDKLTDVEKNYQKALRKTNFLNPYGELSPIFGAAQIDMLWGEFFANGTYTPIKRILEALSNPDNARFAAELAKARRRPSDKEEMDKYMLGRLYASIVKTLSINIKLYPLVEQYCIWAVKNKDIPQAASDVVLDILDNIYTARIAEQKSKSRTNSKPLQQVVLPKINIDK